MFLLPHKHSVACKRVYIMRMKGLEPSLLSELEPKSSASANSATSALVSNTIIATFPWQEGSAIFFLFDQISPSIPIATRGRRCLNPQMISQEIVFN